MMRALLGKDWRVNRVAVAGGIAATVCPYAVVLGMQALYPPAGGNTAGTYLRALENAAEIAMLLTLVMAAVFGGMAFAAERRDRSAEFVAMLPVTRGPVVLSKLFVGVACTATLGAVNGSLLLYAIARRPEAASPVPAPVAAALFAAVLVLYFAVAWALSIYLRSPAVAATVAAGIASAVYFAAAVQSEHAGIAQPSSRDAAAVTFAALCFALGLLVLIGSTAHYVRRVPP